MKSTLVIGGGITGLAVAWKLIRLGRSVTLIEKEPQIGGLSGSFSFAHNRLDRYYHHVFTDHEAIHHLINQLGLQGDFYFRNVRSGFYSNGIIYPISKPSDFLRFRPLSRWNQIRVMAGLASLVWTGYRPYYDRISAATLLSRRCGPEGYRLMWKPLLINKFGDQAEQVSGAWVWDRLQSRSRSRHGGECLGYLKGGFQNLLDRMADEIKQHGGQIETGYPINRIILTPDQHFTIQSDSRRFQHCIVTTPVPEFLRIAPSLPGNYHHHLNQIDYAHSIGIILILNRSLSPYYWLTIGDDSFPFTAVIEHTHLAAPENYNSRHVVYLARYLSDAHQETMRLSDQDQFQNSIRYLKKLFKSFHESWIEACFIARDHYSQPIFKTGYSKLIPSFQTPIPGLYLANTAQFYPESRCLNTSLRLADRLIQSLESEVSD